CRRRRIRNGDIQLGHWTKGREWFVEIGGVSYHQHCKFVLVDVLVCYPVHVGGGDLLHGIAEPLEEVGGISVYGYPADFLERFRDAVEKVTTADVNRVAHKYIDKNKLAVLVVGHPADFDKPLSTFGPVTKLDISIPNAPPAA